MERKLIVPKPQRSMQDSFMPRPDYCDRRADITFDGVTIMIDTAICEYYCIRDCPAYRDYVLKVQVRKTRMKGRKRNESSSKKNTKSHR